MNRAAPRDYARRVFTLDVRSVALMRIAVAATVLVDLCLRAVHCSEHYSDDGVLPRDTARALSWLADTSILAISGSPVWSVVVFGIAMALAVLVLVGWRTRLSTLLLWIVILSIQHRNPLVLDHRDVLFSCSLLYGVLLSWGDAFSVDALGAGRRSRCSGAPAIAYIVQVACIYLFAALLKDGPEWRSDYTAVARAVDLEYWAAPAASWLLAHPTLTSVLTVGVVAFEAAVAPLVLCPWRTGIARGVAVAGIIALQLGFAVFFWLDTFPMISIALVLGLVPASLWPRRPAAPPEVAPASSRWITAMSVTVLVYTLALNVISLGDADAFALARRPAELLGIEQRWDMFAPSPSRLDGWFIVESRGADGAAIDLLTGRAVDHARPDSFRAGIRTTRELVYMRRLLAVDDARRDGFAAARCRSAPTAVAIIVYFVPVVDGEQRAPELLVAHDCR